MSFFKSFVMPILGVALLFSCDIARGIRGYEFDINTLEEIELPSYVLSFDGNGGVGAIQSIPIKNKETVTLPANTFTKQDSYFLGWEEGINTYQDGGTYTHQESRDITLKALWSTLPYRYNFNANSKNIEEGSQVQGTVAPIPFSEGEEITVPPNSYVYPGYDFLGWNTQEDGSGTSYLPGDTIVGGGQNRNLYAQWEAQTFTLSYDGNEGQGLSITGGTYETDSSLTIDECSVLSREGYSFAGWNTRPDGLGVDYYAQDRVPMPPEDTTLYAQWASGLYTISFDKNAAEALGVVDSLQSEHNVSVALPSGDSLSYEGYTFGGWTEKADGTPPILEEGTTISVPPRDTTFYAHWHPDSYAFSFKPNGGTGTMAPQIRKAGQLFNLSPNAFLRSGHSFTGWNTEADGSGDAFGNQQSVTMPPKDVTLYAQWSNKFFNLVYYGNGNTGGSTSSDSSSAGEVVVIRDNGYTRDGYSFTGWNTSPNGSGASYSPGDTLTVPAGNVSITALYAQWSAHSYTLRFDSNGGAGTMSPLNKKTDESFTLPANSFTRKDYSFTGWNTAADGSKAAYTDRATFAMSPSDTTLYAQWSLDLYTIKFFKNSGNGKMDSVELSGDNPYTLPPNSFTKSGYVFAGWNTKPGGNGTAYGDGATLTKVNADLKLYAQWDHKLYRVTYHGNTVGVTGSTMQQEEIGYEERVTVSANGFQLAGHTFVEWATQAGGGGSTYDPGDEIVITDSVDLYAQWASDTFTVSFRMPPEYDALIQSDFFQILSLPKDRTVSKGERITLPTATINHKRTARAPGLSTDITIPLILMGWTTNPDISVQDETLAVGEEVVIKKSVVFYPHLTHELNTGGNGNFSVSTQRTGRMGADGRTLIADAWNYYMNNRTGSSRNKEVERIDATYLTDYTTNAPLPDGVVFDADNPDFPLLEGIILQIWFK